MELILWQNHSPKFPKDIPLSLYPSVFKLKPLYFYQFQFMCTNALYICFSHAVGSWYGEQNSIYIIHRCCLQLNFQREFVPVNPIKLNIYIYTFYMLWKKKKFENFLGIKLSSFLFWIFWIRIDLITFCSIKLQLEYLP